MQGNIFSCHISLAKVIEIAKLCPELESPYLNKTEFLVSKETIEEFAKLIGPLN